MRSTIARTVIVPFVLAATALVSTALAAPPHASCLTTAPHHTKTLGPGVASVSETSSLAYWDNDCKCYIMQVDVPSTSSAPRFETSFGFQSTNAITAWNGMNEADCKTIHERAYLYKKEGASWKLVASAETAGNWAFGQPPFSNPGTPSAHYCSTKSTESSGSFNGYAPPASGSDTYRFLRSQEVKGKFQAVTSTASHVPIIH